MRCRVWCVVWLCVVLLCVSSEAALFATSKHTQLYQDLGVRQDASEVEIRKAFRKRAREHHPDLKETYEEKEEAKVQMARLLRAYEVLSDAAKRADYDETGHIAGEAFNPRDHSAQEIFEHYHQTAPIFSKTPTLRTAVAWRRLSQYRGPRLFLLQVYADSCRQCRSLAEAWDVLYHSPLIAAGVMEMYRVDAGSAEGAALTKEQLKVRYDGRPIVLAVVNGEQWRHRALQDELGRGSQQRIYQSLLDFVMGFFYDTYSEVNALQVRRVQDLVDYLSAPRPTENNSSGAAAAAPRVLFPPLLISGVPLALQLRHGSALQVRSVDHEVLLDFVQNYCGMSVEAYDRAGDKVVQPEFVLVSTAALPNMTSIHAHKEEEVKEEEDDDDDDDDEVQQERKRARCGSVHIGVSAALDYDKAERFVQGYLPAREASMAGVAYVDAMSFHDVCRHNCLLLLRPSCAGSHTKEAGEGKSDATDDAMAALLSRNYLSFKTGYVCLDEHAALRQALSTRGVVSQTAGADVPRLVALRGGEDTVVYVLPQQSSCTADGTCAMTAQDIDALLAQIASLDVEAAEGNEEDEEDDTESKSSNRTTTGNKTSEPPQASPRTVSIPPMATLFAPQPFPLSLRQRVTLIGMTVLLAIKPFVSNTLPFVVMYFVHTRILNKRRDRAEAAEAERASQNGHATPNTSTSQPRTAAASSSSSSAGLVLTVADFDAVRDLGEAKTGRGYLLLVFRTSGSDEGGGTQATALRLTQLPHVARDARFTLRALDDANGAAVWREWASAHKPSSLTDAADDVPEQERPLTVVAIRKQRMLAVVKSDAENMTSFLHDLLDGSKTATLPLPSNLTGA